jgi:hypothetical protein
MENPSAGKEQFKMVRKFGYCAHSGTGTFDTVSLFYSYGWRDANNGLHLWSVKSVQKLAGIGREGLNIAPLTLSIKSVQGQA